MAFRWRSTPGIAISSPLSVLFHRAICLPRAQMERTALRFSRVVLFCAAVFDRREFLLFSVCCRSRLAASQVYSNWLGFSANIWQAEEYISFVSKFILGMGLGFEMPVVILVLVKIGILNYSILSKGRRYMIIINLVLGALLTTPEVLTQVLMALPLQLLYEISVWIAWYWERKEKKRMKAQEAVERDL